MNARLAKPIQHDLVYSPGQMPVEIRVLQAISGATIGRAAGKAVVAAQKTLN
jgi:hypothetical protein